jgi:hypothetical protein
VVIGPKRIPQATQQSPVLAQLQKLFFKYFHFLLKVLKTRPITKIRLDGASSAHPHPPVVADTPKPQTFVHRVGSLVASEENSARRSRELRPFNWRTMRWTPYWRPYRTNWIVMFVACASR